MTRLRSMTDHPFTRKPSLPTGPSKPNPASSGRIRPQWMAACCGLALLLSACSGEPAATVTDEGATADLQPPKLSATELAEVLEAEEVFFLDVRSAGEIRELGTLPGHVNIPIDELEDRLAEVPAGLPVVTA